MLIISIFPASAAAIADRSKAKGVSSRPHHVCYWGNSEVSARVGSSQYPKRSFWRGSIKWDEGIGDHLAKYWKPVPLLSIVHSGISTNFAAFW